MTKPYSQDLRKRLLDRIESGQSCRAAANDLAVSASFSIKLKARYDRTGSLEPARVGRPRGSGKLTRFSDFLIGEVETRPDITMPELAARLEEVHGVTAAPAMLSRFLCRAGYTYKKNAHRKGAPARGCRGKTA